ncbi:hypothetical protein [Spirosoma koreense]
MIDFQSPYLQIHIMVVYQELDISQKIDHGHRTVVYADKFMAR